MFLYLIGVLLSLIASILPIWSLIFKGWQFSKRSYYYISFSIVFSALEVLTFFFLKSLLSLFINSNAFWKELLVCPFIIAIYLTNLLNNVYIKIKIIYLGYIKIFLLNWVSLIRNIKFTIHSAFNFSYYNFRGIRIYWWISWLWRLLHSSTCLCSLMTLFNCFILYS